MKFEEFYLYPYFIIDYKINNGHIHMKHIYIPFLFLLIYQKEPNKKEKIYIKYNNSKGIYFNIIIL
ncbi:hypothetical protein PFAG_00776 [Plasmodium falciparum Santa Lucia]|nr:hypothetical protein PFNF135_00898 [Plasmodium falciparum NF135/5.C10]ETW57476.1 hypothetical protein PFUGPA_00550 [Plasmodium falciparum Palo Alto/Uganda]ETW63277.1 hypothetical protein PFMC_00847 [Plasmodium falciparum CAMP/Malaysia]EUT91442.1 hypothetical protein PFAG_00776 [Plasmodium falciparum Santa Lucia]